MARGGRYAQVFAMRFGRETEPAAAKVPEAVGAE
jgi:hypothetical protein